MPYDSDLTYKTAYAYKANLTKRLEYYNEQMVNTYKGLKYFRSLILRYREDMYNNELVTDLLACNENKIRISRGTRLKFLPDVHLDDTLSPLFRVGTNKELIYIYIKGFVKHYSEYIDLYNTVLRLNKAISLPNYTLIYMIKKYFLQVQMSILLGESYTFTRIGVNIKIYGKSRKKKKYGYAILRKTEDWGASQKFLLEQSKTLNNDAYTKYIEHKITRPQFLKLMKPYLFSYENLSGLKWIIYCNKDFDHWVIMSAKYSKLANIHNYSIVPAHSVTTLSGSSIEFTDNCTDLSEIILTEELAFQNKLRALERYDMNYCLKTYKNDLQYN